MVVMMVERKVNLKPGVSLKVTTTSKGGKGVNHTQLTRSNKVRRVKKFQTDTIG